MQLSQYLVSTAAVSALVMGLANFSAAYAQQEYVPKAKVQTLHKAALPGVDGKEVIIKHFALPPGFVGGRHIHPGPVYVYVAEGEFTVETNGGTQTYKAGQLYPEPLNNVMQGKNLSTSDDLELVVFQIGDVGKPMMIKAD
jgi:quercetin dioxygenase-like cupin family protein